MVKCPQCRGVYEKPRILPCGYSVCERCLLLLCASAGGTDLDLSNEDAGQQFECRFCHSAHTTATTASFNAAFPLNMFIVELVARGGLPCTSSSSKAKNKQNCSTTTSSSTAGSGEVLRRKMSELESCFRNSADIIQSYCDRVRQDVQVAGDSVVARVRKLTQQNLDTVRKYEAECMQSFSLNRVKLGQKLAKLKLEIECNSKTNYIATFL